MKQFVDAYHKARTIAEARYTDNHLCSNYNISIKDINEFGIEFEFEEFHRGHQTGFEYVTIFWEEFKTLMTQD